MLKMLMKWNWFISIVYMYIINKYEDYVFIWYYYFRNKMFFCRMEEYLVVDYMNYEDYFYYLFFLW